MSNNLIQLLAPLLEISSVSPVHGQQTETGKNESAKHSQEDSAPVEPKQTKNKHLKKADKTRPPLKKTKSTKLSSKKPKSKKPKLKSKKITKKNFL